MRKLKEKYPDQVRIIAEPKDNDGCIYCEMPAEWFTIRVPKKMNLTDEQKEKLSVRMKRMHGHSPVREQSIEKTSQKPLSDMSDG